MTENFWPETPNNSLNSSSGDFVVNVGVDPFLLLFCRNADDFATAISSTGNPQKFILKEKINRPVSYIKFTMNVNQPKPVIYERPQSMYHLRCHHF